jgi:glycerophosphoryl diester phosphodiesterase
LWLVVWRVEETGRWWRTYHSFIGRVIYRLGRTSFELGIKLRIERWEIPAEYSALCDGEGNLGEEWKRTESGDHQKLLFLVEKYHMQQRVDYCSFHHEALIHLKSLCPEAKITYLFNYMGQPTPLNFVEQVSWFIILFVYKHRERDKACNGGANGVSMLFHYLTKEQVLAAHEKGLSVTVWMPWIFDDSEQDWKHCIQLQVDFICSNYPFGLMHFLSNIVSNNDNIWKQIIA